MTSDDEERIPRVSIRLAGVPGTRVAFVAKHNLRLGKIPAYVDASRTHLNTVLVGATSGDFTAAADASEERYRKRVGQRMQPRQARLVEGIVTFSRAAQGIVGNDLDQAHRCARELVEAIVRDHGHGAHLLSLVFHADESAPHYHFVMEGVGSDGLGLLQRVKRREGIHIQDLGGAAFAPMGIQRGIPVIERIQRGDDTSKTIHRTVRQLHADLPRELDAANKRLAETSATLAELQAKETKTQRLLDKAKAELAQTQSQATVDETRVAKLAERIKTYENRLRKQREAVDARAPVPVEVAVVTGSEKGLLGNRPVIEPQVFYPVAEVDAFVGAITANLLGAKDQAGAADRTRLRAEKQAARLRSIIEPYPSLGWRLQARTGGEDGAEQGRLIHYDKNFVYAVETSTSELIEGPRPVDTRLALGMVLEFDVGQTMVPKKPALRRWGLQAVIDAIGRFVRAQMPSFLPQLRQQLAIETERLERTAREHSVQAGSDEAIEAVDAANCLSCLRPTRAEYDPFQ